jgi:probable O-glycosylation ligase (exosortase A-associated)
MRDLILLGLIACFFVASFRRPYFVALGYIWVDMVQPQRLTYAFLYSAPLSMVMAIGSFAFVLLVDRQRQLRVGLVQVLVGLLAILITVSTFGWAVLPDPAYVKWDWAVKGLVFAAFLPMVLTTKRRIEAAAFMMVLSLAAITISGGINTVLGSSGYGAVSFLLENNTGIFEGSTLATVALACIPLALWLYKHNGIIRPNIFTLLGMSGVVFSYSLVTVGMEARTGLVAGAVLAFLLWLTSRRKLLLAGAFVVAGIIAMPLLPQSFVDRMSTIETYDEDSSASTRLAVWTWTWNYAKEHPQGGGFGVYRINNLEIDVKVREGSGRNVAVDTVVQHQRARAFHSSYFEMLGEQGYVGLAIYLAILVLGLKTAWSLRKVRLPEVDDDLWYRRLGTMMSVGMATYCVGSAFVGIAFQPPYYYLLAITVAASQLAKRKMAARVGQERIAPKVSGPVSATPATAS